MPEWSIGAVSKTVERFAFQGFESLSFRVCEKLARSSGPAFFMADRLRVSFSELSRRSAMGKAKAGRSPASFSQTQGPPRRAERDDERSE